MALVSSVKRLLTKTPYRLHWVSLRSNMAIITFVSARSATTKTAFTAWIIVVIAATSKTAFHLWLKQNLIQSSKHIKCRMQDCACLKVSLDYFVLLTWLRSLVDLLFSGFVLWPSVFLAGSDNHRHTCLPCCSWRSHSKTIAGILGWMFGHKSKVCHLSYFIC